MEALDYLAIVPDRFWADDGPNAGTRYREMEKQVKLLDHVAARIPLVGHSVGLSIGSAELFDTGTRGARGALAGAVRLSLAQRPPFVQPRPGWTRTATWRGWAIPVPYDREVLEMIAGRVERVRERVPAPFLLENNVYYVDLPEQEMGEPEFLNALSPRSGCGLLLDIHNVYVNAVNHGFDAGEFIRGVDLSRVVEVHIAGGSEMGGMYADSHAGPVAEPVWELLDEVLARAPNLCGITFEFEEGYYPLMGGADGVLRELERARRAWARRPAAG